MQMCFWVSLFSLGSSGVVGSLLQRSTRLVIMSSIFAGTGCSWSLWRPVGMWCDAALSRIEPWVMVVFICNLMRMGRWSELRVDRV